jgi:glutamyl-tRNA synthetase
MNGIYIREMAVEQLTDRLLSGPLTGRDLDRELMLKIVPLVQERITKINAEEFDAMTDFFFVSADGLEYDAEALVPKKTEPSAVGPGMQAVRKAFAELDPWEHEAMENLIREIAGQHDMKAGSLFMSVRIAITGKTATPPLLESMMILGKDESLKRLDKAIEKAAALAC